MNVPLLDLTDQNRSIEPELIDTFKRVLRSNQFILGPEVEAFEQTIADFSSVSYGIGVSSGSDALILALMSLGIGQGDEVICPAFTFFATAGAISRVGATPVFVDVCPVCFNIETNSIREAISNKTKAIIPVHLFGQMAEMDEVGKIAKKYNLAIIEDGAQSLGAKYRDNPTGSYGTFGTYSFFPSKNLGGFGDGGMVVTNDEELASKAKILRNHGAEPKYYHQYIGGNFRLDPLQAALLSVKTPKYKEYVQARKNNAQFYINNLLEVEGVEQAKPEHCGCFDQQTEESRHAKLILPVEYQHCDHIWNQFTLRVIGKNKREELREHLSKKGIGAEIYYPVTMDQQECFQGPNLSRVPSVPKVAHQLAKEVLSIPIYPDLTDEMKSYVVESITEFIYS